MGAAAEIAAALCRQFEGFYPCPYLCPAGVPTIGYGSTRYEDGARVTLKDPPITRERAEQLLQWELGQDCVPQALRLCPALLGAGPDALGAISDFAYNLGWPNLRASTLRKRINAQDWAGAAVELRKWVRGGGRVLPGLVKRREAEARLMP